VPELGKTIGEELLIPTKIYSKIIHGILQCNSILGLSHITGGGLVDNITRIIPKACNIVLNRGSWEVPPIFDFLQQTGNISDAEMMRTFNTGIGLVAVASAHGIQDILERLGAMNEKAFVVGEIIERKTTNSKIEWV
jgi:phosphoribosylformylglycinamidine cyclo-ligase